MVAAMLLMCHSSNDPMNVANEGPGVRTHRDGSCHFLEEITGVEESWLIHHEANRDRQPNPSMAQGATEQVENRRSKAFCP